MLKYPTLEQLEENEVDERLKSIDDILARSSGTGNLSDFLIHEYMKILIEYREVLVKK